MKGAKFPALDAYRGAAALCVFVFHTPDYWGVHLPRAPLAVDLFFVLSGFVVAHSYERRLVDRTMTFVDFVMVRFIRLYPMYLISLFLACLPVFMGMVVHHARSGPIVLDYLRATGAGLLMLPARISDMPTVFYPLNVVYWSLFFELVVNFLYAGFAFRLRTQVLAAIAVASGVALVFLVWVNGEIAMGHLWDALSLGGGFVRALFGGSVGVLLFRERSALAGRLAGAGGYWLPLSAIVVLMAAPSVGRADWLLQLAAVLIIFPWCIIRGTQGLQPTGRSMMHRMLRTLGLLSYPIYVLHMPLEHLVRIAVSDGATHAIARFAPFSGWALLALLIGLSLAGERWLDQPIRHWLTSRVFGGRAASAPVMSEAGGRA